MRPAFLRGDTWSQVLDSDLLCNGTWSIIDRVDLSTGLSGYIAFTVRLKRTYRRLLTIFVYIRQPGGAKKFLQPIFSHKAHFTGTVYNLSASSSYELCFVPNLMTPNEITVETVCQSIRVGYISLAFIIAVSICSAAFVLCLVISLTLLCRKGRNKNGLNLLHQMTLPPETKRTNPLYASNHTSPEARPPLNPSRDSGRASLDSLSSLTLTIKSGSIPLWTRANGRRRPQCGDRPVQLMPSERSSQFNERIPLPSVSGHVFNGTAARTRCNPDALYVSSLWWRSGRINGNSNGCLDVNRYRRNDTPASDGVHL